jgi:two-component system NtrC family sensor kinase
MKWLFRKIPLGLRTEIVLNIAVLTMASLLLVGLTLLMVSEQEILEQKIAGSRIVLFSLQRGINAFQGVNWQQDRRFLQILAGSTQLKGVKGIWIVDKDLRSLVTRGSGQRYDEALLKAMAQGDAGERLEKTGILWWTSYDRLVLTAPLVGEGKIIGGVQVAFSMADVMDRLVVFRRLFLVLIVMDSLVIIGFGSILLSRVVVNPLKRLVKVAQSIGGGNLGQRAPVDYENEIGTLAKAFNQMVERLTEKQSDLQRAIKQLRDMQEELVSSEKLASVGRMAAGVAHEIGNPLTSVLGHTEILHKRLKHKRLKDGEVLLDLVERTRKETERINRIIKDLLQFSKPPSPHGEDVDVNRLVQDSLNVVSVQERFHNIAIDLSLAEDLPLVQGNSDQLQQVLFNILINAADAMPDGGSLSIKTEKEKQWVIIAAKDTGVGIAPDDLGKIYDPFFTTKSPDKGTGLGLSISLKIIDELGGRIKVQSEQGKGTEFIVYLKKASQGSVKEKRNREKRQVVIQRVG